MNDESPAVEAITLARAAFSSAQGQLGLIKFSVERLVPADGADETKSKIWDLTCSFYETLGSPTPTKYAATINLADKTVSIIKVGGGEAGRKFTITEQGTGVESPNQAAGPGDGSVPPPGK
jgi:hypothetical protein